MDVFSITRSRLREDLLTLYFMNPSRKFFLRELERILQFPVGNLRRELIHLERMGLFFRENKGNLVYYSLNQSYPIFEELKSIIFKISGVSKMIRDVLYLFKGISFAFLYGSFATGEEEEGSDIDLLIIGKVDEDSLLEGLSKVEQKIQREINYYIYEKTEFDTKKRTDHSFLSELSKVEKIFLVGDETELMALPDSIAGK